jgi:hypothetical protein
MQISEKDRAALDDPTLEASESHYAYNPYTADKPMRYAAETWATKHGFDLTATRDSTVAIKQDPH